MNGSVIWFGFLLSLWSQVRAVAMRVSAIFVVRAVFQHEAGRAIQRYCWRHLTPAPFSELSFTTRSVFVRSRRRMMSVAVEGVGFQSRIFWRREGWKIFPLFVGAGAQVTVGGGGGPGYATDRNSAVTVSFIRGTWDAEKLIVEALDDMMGALDAAFKMRRFRVQTYRGARPYRGQGDTAPGGNTLQELPFTGEDRVVGFHPDDIGEEAENAPGLSALCFPAHVDDAVRDARRWLESEAWYRTKRIPWRYGWLLYGPPGTGKTSLVRAMAQDLNLPVCVFHLASLSNEEMVRYWAEIQTKAPCVALLEDVDVVFDGRENRLGEMGGGLSFDTLLNCLSGIEIAHGIFTVVTTNRIDCIDSALGVPAQRSQDGEVQISTRPGRIDRAIHLGPMTDHDRERLARRILEDCPDRIPELVQAGAGDTPAQFQERCSQVALEHHWRPAADAPKDLYVRCAPHRRILPCYECTPVCAVNVEGVRSQVEKDRLPAHHGFGSHPDTGMLVKW